MLSRLLKRFKRPAAAEPGVLLGFMYRVENEALDVSACGSPREIKDVLAAQGLAVRDTLHHIDTEIAVAEVFQEEPLLEFHGGPDAETILELIDCLCTGDSKGVSERAPVLRRDSDGVQIPLLAAVAAGDLDQVELLLRLGAQVDLRGDLGMSPLHWAAGLGEGVLVERLAAAGASSESVSWFCLTPGEVAALNGHQGLARGLGYTRLDTDWHKVSFARMEAL